MDDEVDIRKNVRLRNLLLDMHQCRKVTEGARVDAGPGGHEHVTSAACDLECRRA